MEVYKNVDEGETRLQDFIVDFIDPNAPEEIQSPINKAEVTEDEDEDETRWILDPIRMRSRRE